MTQHGEPRPTPASEPLLWLQLLAIGALPLEGLLLLLVLAGADPGPLPWLERLLAWGMGVLAPTLVLWRRPADCGSLLLVQVPTQARSPLQRQLASLQNSLPTRLLLVLGAALLLPGFWWLDSSAVVAANSTPLVDSNRLVTLLLAIPLLAVMLWQWHQLSQSLWLLSRSAESLEAAPPMGSSSLASERICLGIPLLLLEPLREAAPSSRSGPVDGAVAIEPEEAAEEQQGSQLDGEVP